jgi:hypothetical protein
LLGRRVTFVVEECERRASERLSLQVGGKRFDRRMISEVRLGLDARECASDRLFDLRLAPEQGGYSSGRAPLGLASFVPDRTAMGFRGRMAVDAEIRVPASYEVEVDLEKAVAAVEVNALDPLAARLVLYAAIRRAHEAVSTFSYADEDAAITREPFNDALRSLLTGEEIRERGLQFTNVAGARGEVATRAAVDVAGLLCRDNATVASRRRPGTAGHEYDEEQRCTHTARVLRGPRSRAALAMAP